MNEAAAQDWILIRADGSAPIGVGHIVRCLALADALKAYGYRIRFFCRHVGDTLGSWIADAGHFLTRLPQDGPPPGPDAGEYGRLLGTTEAHDAQSLLAAIDTLTPPAAIVVDHYALGAGWEAAIREGFGCPILAIDDLTREHVADCLVDSTFGRSAQDYAGLLPDGVPVLAGADYAMLRADFAQLRPDILASRDRGFRQKAPARSLLVAMGGGDPHNLTGCLAEMLRPVAAERGLKLIAMIGPAFPHEAQLCELAASSAGTIEVRQNVRDVARLLGAVDLCVGAGGSASLERCCLGLPMISIAIAANQIPLAERLDRAGAIVFGGAVGGRGDGAACAAEFAEMEITHLAGRILDNIGWRERLSLAARDVADGRGAERLARHVHGMVAGGFAV
ncbi:UDP-2,4-diacetamido-2,4,6-trideoxy-beta-L-altropyranose hydrolase [Aurantimonas sp. VKM B-3413]|uniref:UDP-2,4-diacetamido-2,4, 6-trideoxy-beta-L-altropyranose hydrolase n=1 Tax=Aurantimonas sp. VKM B-3413 TaxID=2779401 RepID=UPI001E44E977|nr:UDP-2,4-diacetamido-2,4,6-trideoxy-beta-L-altropyranose hydrolase [Aurantimonas sp. VKM B-3413]MCB8838609.1 UDP-2,4-diacetamido-2,4,6-trideoxy-beta-L-altropyranose hydrolase [Aurantimonas sp. VKM B-3413]